MFVRTGRGRNAEFQVARERLRSIAAKSPVTVFAHVEPEIQTVDISLMSTFADVKRPISPAASQSLGTSDCMSLLPLLSFCRSRIRVPGVHHAGRALRLTDSVAARITVQMNGPFAST